MSDKIDQRIVEMSFENKKFEKGIAQSKNSLKEFSNALKKSDIGKDFSGLEKSVTSVSSSFSMLEQIGIGALRKIGEAAVDAGAKLIKSLSVDQLTAGWSKYEEKLDAVQTLVSAGYDIDDVNAQMEQLMWFSDETSYSFSDMANNMGKFVSAGVELKTSSKAMQGIATWAAMSGKNSQAASIAMFNLAQSISLGYVDTLNWRSIMNQNMNTVMFKQIAIGVAEATGAIKEGQVTIQNFDSNLKDKWFTNDVLLKTLEQYSNYAEKVREVQEEMNFDTATQAMEYMDQHADKYGDVLNQIGNAAFKASQESKKFSDSISATMDAVSSGWMRTYEIIFGELEEAKANFTALTEILWTVFASGAEHRNEMLKWLKEAGGISNVFQGFKNTAVSLLKVLKPISAAFDQIFPPKTKEQWLEITEAFKDFTATLLITDETASKIQRTFAGVFAVLDIGWQVLKFLGSAALEVIKIFIPLGDGALGASASLGDFLVRINELLKSSQLLQYSLLAVKVGVALFRNGLKNVTGIVKEFVLELWTAEKPFEFLANAGRKVFNGLIDNIKMAASWLTGKLTKAFQSAIDLFSKTEDDGKKGFWAGVFDILKNIVTFIGGEASKAFTDFGSSIKNLDLNKVATFVVGGVLLIFVKQISDLTGAMTSLTTATSGAINAFTKKFLGYKTTTNIRDMGYALGILTASIWVLSTIPAEDLKKSLIGLSVAIGTFVAAYGMITGIQVAASKLMKNTEMVSTGFGLVGVAAAMVVMSMALKIIAGIEGSLGPAFLVITGLVGLVSAYQVLAVLISKIPDQKEVVFNLVGLSASILALAAAVRLLNKFTINELGQGIVKLTTLLSVITAFELVVGMATRIGGGNKVAVGFLGLASGILALVGVMAVLGAINPGVIAKGVTNLVLITGLLAAIEIVMGLASRVKGENKAQANILKVTITLAAMVGLIKLISFFTPEELKQGIHTLTAMVAIIGAIELFTAQAAWLSGGAKVQKILGSVALTLVAFTAVIAVLGSIGSTNPETIDKGLVILLKMVGIISAIELITAVSSRISTSGNMFGSLIGVTIAIAALTGAIALLSLPDQDRLRNAVTSLGIASIAVAALSIALSQMFKSVSLISNGGSTFVDKVKNIGLMLVGIVSLMVAVGVFFGAFKIVEPWLTDVTWEKLAMFTVGIASITALLIALDTIPMSDKGFKDRMAFLGSSLISVTGLVIIASGMFWAMSKIEMPDLLTIGKFTLGLLALTGVFSAIALLMPILSKVPNGAAVPALKAGGVVIALTIGIVATTALLAAAMDALISNEASLQRGLNLLVDVGIGLGRFIGGAIGGLVGGVLEGAGVALANFVSALGSVDSTAIDNVGKIATALLAITGAAVLNGIAGLMRLNPFADDPLTKLAKQLSSFIAVIKEVSPEDAGASSDVIRALAPMAENLSTLANAAKDIPNSGGFIGRFMGENDIDKFGKDLSGFISAFSNLSPQDAVDAGNVLEAMKPMIDNLKLFAAAARNIPNSGGFMGEFMGENDIDVFGTMLAGFVSAFADVTKDQAEKASEVLEAMKPMADNLKEFAYAAQEIPTAGGVVGTFLGTVDLATFSSQIRGLIGTFGSVNSTQLSLATQTLELMTDAMLPSLVKFSEFTNGLKNSGGVAQFFTGNTTLSEFGKELKKFIKTLSESDFEIVKPALKAMSDITRSFNTLGSDVIENSKKSFDNNKEPFQKSISTILDAPIFEITAKKNKLKDAIIEALQLAFDGGRAYQSRFYTIGTGIMQGLSKGISDNALLPVGAIQSVSASVVYAAQKAFDCNSPSKIFETIGAWCDKGLAYGLTKNTNAVVLAGRNMAEATEESIRDALGVHSLSTLFADIGGWIPESLSAGIQNGSGGLIDLAKSLGIEVGNTITGTIKEGVEQGEGGLSAKIDSLLALLLGSDSSAAGEAAAGGASLGNSVTGGFQSSISDATSGLGGRATKSIVKTELDKLKAFIEEGQFYGTITLQEELDLYQELRKKYKIGSEERSAIDREVYSRLKNIYDAQMEYIDGVRNAQKEAAEERARLDTEYQESVLEAQTDAKKKLADLDKKYYDDVAKAQEDADKKRANEDKSYFANLSSLLDQAEKDRQKTREQYAEKQKSINQKLLQDIDAQNKAYENAVKSRADAIYGSYGLFDSVGIDPEVSGEELLKNLQDQGAAISEWRQSLDELAARGVGDAIIEEIQAMGPSSKAQIKALLTLTDDQLSEYVALFEGKYSLARVRAEQELEGMKNDTAQAIQDLNAQAAIDLDALRLEFENALSEINDTMAVDMAELKATHEEALFEINSDLTEKLGELKQTWQESTSEINLTLSEKLSELEKSYNASMVKVNSDLRKNLDEMKTKYDSTMKTIRGLTETELTKLISENNKALTTLNTDSERKLAEVKGTYSSGANGAVGAFIKGLTPIIATTISTVGTMISRSQSTINASTGDFNASGYNVAVGFAQGIRSGDNPVINAARFIAQLAVTTANSVLDERSPSRVFEQIGRFVGLGFANGIVEYSDKVRAVSEQLASGPIDAVTQALLDMEDNDDFSFTITPVLDLSNIKSNQLSQLLQTPVALGSTSVKMAAEVGQKGRTLQGESVQIVNKFDCTGMVVREEADIDKIANRLYQKQQTASRGRGVRVPTRA